MKKEELFKQKGELTFQLEMIQARLSNINEQLVRLFNEENNPMKSMKIPSGENHTPSIVQP